MFVLSPQKCHLLKTHRAQKVSVRESIITASRDILYDSGMWNDG